LRQRCFPKESLQGRVGTSPPLIFIRYVAKINILRYIVITVLMLLLPLPAFSDSWQRQNGYVVAYNYEISDTQENNEISHDHINAYANIHKWLEQNKIGHSYKALSQFAVTLSSGTTINFDRSSLIYAVGTVLIRAEGNYKILEGVYTDVDLIEEIQEYIKPADN
jgi:hypothetical protein